MNTNEPPPRREPTTSSPPTVNRSTNADLVNAYDYYAQSRGRKGYYFTTPSGRWRCAILPHDKAGCQSSSQSAIAVSGAPDSVPDAQGDPTAPNAVLVDDVGDAQFASLDQREFSLSSGPAKVLPFNKILAAAGFRCNVQEESGIACLSDSTGKGFTFTTSGYLPHYTDVPA